MNHNELTVFSDWIKQVDRWMEPDGTSVYDVVKPNIVLFYWFKAHITTFEAVNMAIVNRERTDTAVILQEAKNMLARQKRVVATGDRHGFTAVSPDYEEDIFILSQEIETTQEKAR